MGHQQTLKTQMSDTLSVSALLAIYQLKSFENFEQHQLIMNNRLFQENKRMETSVWHKWVNKDFPTFLKSGPGASLFGKISLEPSQSEKLESA